MPAPHTDLDYVAHLALVVRTFSDAATTYWNYREWLFDFEHHKALPQEAKIAQNVMSQTLSAGAGTSLLAMWEKPDGVDSQTYSVLAAYEYLAFANHNLDSAYDERRSLSRLSVNPNARLLGIRLCYRVANSSMLLSMRNIRNKYWAHRIESTRQELKGKEFLDVQFKHIDTLYVCTAAALHLLFESLSPETEKVVRSEIEKATMSARLLAQARNASTQ